MEWEELNGIESEIVLTAINTEKIYPAYLMACHSCANDALKGELTEKKAIHRFMPVITLAVVKMGKNGYVTTPLLRERKKAAKFIYEMESGEMIKEMETGVKTYIRLLKYPLQGVMVTKRELLTFTPGKAVKRESL